MDAGTHTGGGDSAPPASQGNGPGVQQQPLRGHTAVCWAVGPVLNRRALAHNTMARTDRALYQLGEGLAAGVSRQTTQSAASRTCACWPNICGKPCGVRGEDGAQDAFHGGAQRRLPPHTRAWGWRRRSVGATGRKHRARLSPAWADLREMDTAAWAAVIKHSRGGMSAIARLVPPAA
jgi:hypothetical protein